MFAELVAWVVDSSSDSSLSSSRPATSGHGKNGAEDRPDHRPTSFVHPAVQWKPSTRGLYSGQNLAAGTIILRIPTLCGSKTSNINSSRSSSSIHVQDETDVAPKQPILNDPQPESIPESTPFYHETQDVEMAWELAHQPSCWKPYLDSLPSTIDLPRMHIPKEQQPKLSHSRETGTSGNDTEYSKDDVSRKRPRHSMTLHQTYSWTGTSVQSRIEQGAVGVATDYARLVSMSTTSASLSKEKQPRPNEQLLEATNDPTVVVVEHQTSPSLPSLDEFSYALAVVTSRAFHVDLVPSQLSPLFAESVASTATTATAATAAPETCRRAVYHMPSTTSSSLPVLVPILDLCNHCRGGASAKKNLSYSFEVVQQQWNDDNVHENADADAAAATKNIDAGGHTIVWCTVTVVAPIVAGDDLRITYGALSNSALFVNYGFCLADNIEPDGSSNDVLEFEPTDDCSENQSKQSKQPAATIQLRTGPKSYTYPCLVTALQWFRGDRGADSNEDSGTTLMDDVSNQQRNDSTAMEDFLIECDEEEMHGEDDDEEEEDNDIDFYNSTNEAATAGITSGKDGNESSDIRADLEALSQFRRRLLQVANGYPKQQAQKLNRSDTTTTTNVANASNTHDHFAELLIHSELRTLQFYVWAVDRVVNHLQSFAPSKERVQSPPPASLSSAFIVSLTPEDTALVDTQINELVSAFMQIRHSDQVVTSHTSTNVTSLTLLQGSKTPS